MTYKGNLNKELKRYFGFDKFKGDQEAIIRNLLDGNDTFVLTSTWFFINAMSGDTTIAVPSMMSDGS